MMRKCFTTYQLISHSNTGGTVFRRDKYSIFQMEKPVLWSTDFAGGKDIAGKEDGMGVERQGRGDRPSG